MDYNTFGLFRQRQMLEDRLGQLEGEHWATSHMLDEIKSLSDPSEDDLNATVTHRRKLAELEDRWTITKQKFDQIEAQEGGSPGSKDELPAHRPK